MGASKRKSVKARVQRRKFLKNVLKGLKEERDKNGATYDIDQKIEYYENQIYRM